MVMFLAMFNYFDVFFTDANKYYCIHFYQSKSRELQVAFVSVSLCRPVYAEVGIIYVSEIE